MGAPPPSPHLTARLCGLPRSWENKTVDSCSWGRRPDLPSNNAEAPPVAETARRCWRRAPIFARAQVPPQILVQRKRSGPASRPSSCAELVFPARQIPLEKTRPRRQQQLPVSPAGRGRLRSSASAALPAHLMFPPPCGLFLLRWLISAAPPGGKRRDLPGRKGGWVGISIKPRSPICFLAVEDIPLFRLPVSPCILQPQTAKPHNLPGRKISN